MNDKVNSEVNKAEEIESTTIDKNPEDVFELNLPIWAVVNFDSCVANDLTYDEAFEKMLEQKTKNASGLCIVTNDAAARISKS
jgi:hypothetical protein